VSCRIISNEEFDNKIPVNPPTVNKKRNPDDHNIGGFIFICAPYIVDIHLKILIPVGIAITIVAEVKYARVSTSIPTVNIWWAHTMNPNSPIPDIA
jgi:hypothetical protein